MTRVHAKLAELRALRAALVLDLRAMSAEHPGRPVRERLLEAHTAQLASIMATGLRAGLRAVR